MLLIVMWTILVWVLSHLGHAIPHYSNTSSSPAQHAALNPCDGINASPILYHDYGEPECPPNVRFNYDNGFCEGWDRRDEQQDCASFCQTSTLFIRAQEVPFPLSECHWPMECELTQSDTASWNWGVGFTGKIKMALVTGISGGYGQTYGMSDGHSWKFAPEPHECGYFSFIPVKKITCGPYTDAEESWWSGCYDPKTHVDFCVGQVWKVGDRDDGVVIFVKINCVDRTPLPMNQQDPIYSLPGVALDRGAYTTLMNAWTWNSCKTWKTTSPRGIVNAYEIRGINFPEGPLGANGEHLRDKIKECGDTGACDWSFELTPEDRVRNPPNHPWDWRATGCLSLGANTKCIGDAIVLAGGSAMAHNGCA